MEIQSVAIAFGLIVTLLFSEMFGLAAGGLVVPGYVALFFDKPWCIVLTLGVALATYGVVKGLSRWIIVYGKRRTMLMIVLGFFFGTLLRAIPLENAREWLSLGSSQVSELSVIGFIIPGLIAIWMDRQGLIETVSSLLTTSVVVRLVLILMGVGLLA